MKKTVFTGIICMIFAMSVFSQDISPISIKKKGLGSKYMQNDKVINRKELQSILSNSPVSAEEYKIAQTNGTIGSLLMGGGALYMGASSLYFSIQDAKDVNNGDLSNINDNSKKSTTHFLIGAGIALVGIPLFLTSNSHLIKSIKLYNSQNSTAKLSVVEVSFGVTQEGIGLRFNF